MGPPPLGKGGLKPPFKPPFNEILQKRNRLLNQVISELLNSIKHNHKHQLCCVMQSLELNVFRLEPKLIQQSSDDQCISVWIQR